VALVLAVIILAFSKNLEQAAQIGEFISGFAAALAFLWLIASFQLQAREIAAQREELKLQRTALEGQALELINASKFSALSQIADIMEKARDKVASSHIVKDEGELLGRFTAELPVWKIILESKNPQQVQDSYQAWLKIEGLVRGYISSIAMALRIYLEYFARQDFDRSQNDEDFVYVYQTWMNKVPYLSEHSANAFMLANFLMMYQPALKAMRLAGLMSSADVFGKSLFKEGALEQMKKELQESGAPIPAIAENL
jgi:thiaminase